ncbi:MAG TPA: PKD domain-containing protein, partial [Aggregatilineaceae bacterium]|nr:PKD domain-containing protein [Aggregatilineaceae bacterium]
IATADVDVAPPVNLPPQASAGGPYATDVGQVLTFDASSSTDSDGQIVGYMWDWENDGRWDTSWTTSPTAQHTYEHIFEGEARLQVVDNLGSTSTATAQVTITDHLLVPHGITIPDVCPGSQMGACCDPQAGQCIDTVRLQDCPAPNDFYAGQACWQLPPPCGETMIGACCDPQTPACWDGIPMQACAPPYQSFPDQTCDQLPPLCGLNPTGACCDPNFGECHNGVTPEACEQPAEFYPDQTCDQLPPPCYQPPTGACCNAETTQCVDQVSSTDCQAPNEFFQGQTCVQLPPPCNPYPIGACCNPATAECWDGIPSPLCSAPGVFHPGQSCAELPPPCGQGGGPPCHLMIALWDSWGDGWNGGYVDVYVNGDLRLAQVTLPDGTGPQMMPFPAHHGDVISTVWVAGDKPCECYYCISDESGNLLGCDNRPANEPPQADAGGPYSGFAGQAITFDASNSHDPDGTIAVYRWDWQNDGEWDTEWLTEPTTTSAYDTAFTGQVRLQVVDNGGATSIAVATVNIAANAAPLARAGGPYTVCGDEPINFDASASSDPDGTIVGYRWDWTSDGEWDTEWLTLPTAQHSYPIGFRGKVRLQVQDNHEAMATTYAVVSIGTLGDVNGDGVVNGLDVDGFVRAKLGGPPLPGENQACADYGGTLEQDLATFIADLLGS